MLQAVIHLIKGNIGPGMLALPRAVSLGGLWFGSTGIVFLSVFCIQCMHLIVECSQRLALNTGRSYLSYPDVAEFTFSTAPDKRLHRYAKFFRYTIVSIFHVFLPTFRLC